MKVKIHTNFYFSIYFFFLMFFYHVKIKDYYYWRYHAYLNNTFFDFAYDRFFVAILVFFINLRIVKRISGEKLIFAVLSFFFTLVTVPSLIAFVSKNVYPLKLLFFHQLFFYSIYLSSKIKIPLDKLPIINKTASLNLLFVIITLGIIPYLFILGPYINFNNLLLKEIYETRAKMGSLSNPYFGYTYSLFTKILIPIAIVFSIELKKWTILLLSLIYLILFYLFGAHKAVYVGIIAMFVFYRLSYLSAVKKYLKYSLLLISISYCLSLFNYDQLWILIFRRVHFLPSLLDIQYLEFFENKPLYWSNSFLRFFNDYPYDLSHPQLIGELYYRDKDMSANNGLISDGYMNFGVFGAIINILIVATYFTFLNSLNIKPKYFGIYLLIIISFISSSTFTVFLTHGGLALLLVSIFVLNEKRKKDLSLDICT